MTRSSVSPRCTVTVPLAMAEAAGAEVFAEGLVCARPSAEWAGVGGKPPIC
jgi:hypothetical protein